MAKGQDDLSHDGETLPNVLWSFSSSVVEMVGEYRFPVFQHVNVKCPGRLVFIRVVTLNGECVGGFLGKVQFRVFNKVELCTLSITVKVRVHEAGTGGIMHAVKHGEATMVFGDVTYAPRDAVEQGSGEWLRCMWPVDVIAGANELEFCRAVLPPYLEIEPSSGISHKHNLLEDPAARELEQRVLHQRISKEYPKREDKTLNYLANEWYPSPSLHVIEALLDRITSTSLVPTAATGVGTAPAGGGDVASHTSGDEMEMQDRNKPGLKDKEETVISWQQKIFSQATEYLTTSPNEHPTFLSEKMAHVRKRRVGTGNKQKRERDHTFVPKLNIIEDDPNEELILRNHLGSTPIQVMHIMADLSPGKGAPALDEEEVVLCTIQIKGDGVLSIHPDFNRGRKAYVKESQKQQEADRELKMFREVYSRHKDFLQACVGGDFDMPGPDVLRMLVYGEIESAKNFEYDDLYLHFFVDLPKYWTVERQQPMSWITQTCSTKVLGRDDVAYFSFPFHFEAFYHNDNLDEEEKELEIPRFPTIMVEVLSLDSWQRYRTEGYSYLTVPGQPGRHQETIQCWRPMGSSVTSQLRRFFIGGSPELEDPTYQAIPSTFQGKYLSKYGFKTESTGSVDISLNVIMQSRAFRDKKANRQSLSSLLEALGINAVQQNISNVLDAFKKARQRMLQTRENVSQGMLKTGCWLKSRNKLNGADKSEGHSWCEVVP
ncbi:MKS1-like protein [Mya arenaria]|uniref:MKS1-like protein n=1 Tax=Mya arenaria TaxID=6604 RepID=A0ABY7E239_MYAAR|nr:MKS1-like protein [Mya arenaria]